MGLYIDASIETQFIPTPPPPKKTVRLSAKSSHSKISFIFNFFYKKIVILGRAVWPKNKRVIVPGS